MSLPSLPAAQLRWDAERGVPFSSRFDDVYHSFSGALAQTRHVFMGGCGLPEGWQARPRFTIVETGFGLGLNFLATWLAWQQDPQRCDHLHFVSVEGYPVAAADIVRAVAQSRDLQALAPLTHALAERYPQPARPGVHRLLFPHPHNRQQSVTLTLALGDAARLLPQLRLQADAAYFDGFSPAKNPELWQPPIFKAVARLLRPGAWAATWTIAAGVRKGLTEAGFVLTRRPGLPPKRDSLQARYVPWHLRGDPRDDLRGDAAAPLTPPQPPHNASARHAVVIGAGMAGASACWALSRRGWRVTLIDAAPQPAAGASGLPVGLCVPHVSPDDAVISRLTRAGAHWLRQVIELSGLPPSDWRSGDVWQILDDTAETDDDDSDDVQASSASSTAATQARQRRDAALGASQQALPGGYEGPALRHDQGLSVKGPALVRHWLGQCPGLQTRWSTTVARVERADADAPGQPPRWLIKDEAGHLIAEAETVVVASALQTPGLLPTDPVSNGPSVQQLIPLRGQITLGRWPGAGQPLPGELPPLTGHGHFIANWPPRADDNERWDWAMGSSFERADTDLAPRRASDQANLAKLRHAMPDLADVLAPQFNDEPHTRPPGLQPWVQIRATTNDHLPLAGPVADWQAAGQHPRPGHRGAASMRWSLDALPRLPGLYVLCGFGARGLSLAALCAELVASQIDGDPWPLDAALAQAVDPARFEFKRRRQSAPQPAQAAVVSKPAPAQSVE
ncbi:MAG: tRNA 5-methylaminomethyl-2-thiouridine biosynthesis bifunctional protein MnmC [Paracidovorax wautersii]|uniref:tRNA 5-methylaminomethyl-2-thiouridine biosynthesis bifunctional protein MnmC n=1 Tax=Paracidovorax wautersii TaxID=1177982 RepID=A0A7V8FMD6_9BURK|nr:MAG: tRNA 5-methylaminomethyl-2-thiouridine biosynthesis bifunctional protein MnmC [Paracidovorax wautersii]